MLRFGTDGVRGVANAELSPELVLALGRAAARVVVPAEGDRAGRRRCLIGRDTRLSGGLLTAALAAGMAAEGVDVVDLGVIPTPGLAALSEGDQVPAAMISASHNPFADNGIKLFAAGGRKLATDVESRLEAVLDQILATGGDGRGARTDAPGVAPSVATGTGVGAVETAPGAAVRYRDHLLAALEGRRADGMTVVLDCAHGAAAAVAPQAFADAGVSVLDVLGAAPDGANINAGCGSTDPAALAAAVVRQGAGLGLAFDGDADRVIAVDEAGGVVDGDRLLALFATDLSQRGRLRGDTVVVTVMTNLGFHRAMQSAGIAVKTTPVGDRHVLEALEDGGWSLGGEQSGHLVFRDLATTGDGILSGLLLCDLLCRAGRPLGELARACMNRLPQVLHNVPVARRDGLADAAPVWAEVRAVEAELGAGGRVVLRPSGTEPLIRVMVEAPTPDQAEAAAARITHALGATLG